MASSGSGAWPPQRTAISINGAARPAASSIKTLAGQSISTGTSFKVALAPYSMTWLKIPLSSVAIAPRQVEALQGAIAPEVRQIGRREFSVTVSGTFAG